MIRNWIQRRRLIKQLRAAGYSDEAIHEILRFYGVDPK
jgi:DNA-binding transcriptional MerR regulator